MLLPNLILAHFFGPSLHVFFVSSADRRPHEFLSQLLELAGEGVGFVRVDDVVGVGAVETTVGGLLANETLHVE